MFYAAESRQAGPSHVFRHSVYGRQLGLRDDIGPHDSSLRDNSTKRPRTLQDCPKKKVLLFIHSSLGVSVEYLLKENVFCKGLPGLNCQSADELSAVDPAAEASRDSRLLLKQEAPKTLLNHFLMNLSAAFLVPLLLLVSKLCFDTVEIESSLTSKLHCTILLVVWPPVDPFVSEGETK